MGKIVFVLGGARSGKSAMLEACAASVGPRIAYIATGLPHGRDMVARIAKHDARRPATWPLHKATHVLAPTMEQVVAAGDIDGIVLECLFVWTVNQILTLGEENSPDFNDQQEALEKRHLDDLRAAIAIARASPYPTLLASNEAGLGLSPDRRRQRAFRDLLGRVNETAAVESDRAVFVVAGHALDLKTLHLPPDKWL
ncbi:bifunctional adenosylcobinamide kinase/adenosylcobinamide-phosphate guanylyltransferase [soil metagenome]